MPEWTQIKNAKQKSDDSIATHVRSRSMMSGTRGLLLALSGFCAILGILLSDRGSSRAGEVGKRSRSETAALDKEFKLKFGQQVALGGEDFTVKFSSLVDDSRCPAKVECVWSGNAEILIEVKRRGQNGTTLKLDTASGDRFTREQRHGQYRIRLVAVTPYPRTDKQVEPSEYTATLLINKG